jgi:hypothetical protein
MGVLGKVGGAGRLTGLKAKGLAILELLELSIVEWERVRSAHPTHCVSAVDGVPALARTAQRRRGGAFRCGVYRTTRASWNTTAGVQVLVFAVL